MLRPRVYTYKITFSEVPYFYWGAHKEKKHGEAYLGSPVTHKWAWEFYTPVIQVLEFFDTWEEAQQVEERLIKPFLDHPFCLNEHCSGKISLEKRRQGGVTCVEKNRNNKTGLHGMSKQQLSEAAKKARALTSKEQYRENGLKLSHEERVRRGKITTSQRWKCLVTGHISTAPALSNYQKKRGISTHLRERIL